MVDDGQHPARPRHAEGLGEDGRRLQGRQADARQAPDARGVRRRLGLQLRRGPARRQGTRRPPPEDRRRARLGHELGRGRGRRRVPERLLLLPAAALQPLHPAGVPRGVSQPGALQARGGRSGPARRGPLPGSTPVRARLPLQEDLLQLRAKGQPAVHHVLPPRRAGRGPRLRAPVSRPCRVVRHAGRRRRPRRQVGAEVEGSTAPPPRVWDRA